MTDARENLLRNLAALASWQRLAGDPRDFYEVAFNREEAKDICALAAAGLDAQAAKSPRDDVEQATPRSIGIYAVRWSAESHYGAAQWSGAGWRPQKDGCVGGVWHETATNRRPHWIGPRLDGGPSGRDDAQAAVAEGREACAYLERVVANVAPAPTKPLVGDLIGICTQVDNLICWVRERARAEERERCARWHGLQSAEMRARMARADGNQNKRFWLSRAEFHDESAAALRALGPTSDAIAEARAAAIEECVRHLVTEADRIEAEACQMVKGDARRALERVDDAGGYRYAAAALRALAKKEG